MEKLYKLPGLHSMPSVFPDKELYSIITILNNSPVSDTVKVSDTGIMSFSVNDTRQEYPIIESAKDNCSVIICDIKETPYNKTYNKCYIYCHRNKKETANYGLWFADSNTGAVLHHWYIEPEYSEILRHIKIILDSFKRKPLWEYYHKKVTAKNSSELPTTGDYMNVKKIIKSYA